MDAPDGRYDSRPWNMVGAPPNQTAPEALVTDRLLALLQQPEMGPRVAPDTVMFRTRFGYRTRELGIMDLIEADIPQAPQPSVDYSGGSASYSGTSRNDLGSV